MQLGITRNNVASLATDVVARITSYEIALVFPNAPIVDDVAIFPTTAGGQDAGISSRADNTTTREIKDMRGIALKPIMPLTTVRSNTPLSPTTTLISTRTVSNDLP